MAVLTGTAPGAADGWPRRRAGTLRNRPAVTAAQASGAATSPARLRQRRLGCRGGSAVIAEARQRGGADLRVQHGPAGVRRGRENRAGLAACRYFVRGE